MMAPYISGRVVEFGCGPANSLVRHGDRIEAYCGIDSSARAIVRLREAFPHHTFVCADLGEPIEELPFQADSLLMIALIEHIFDQKTLMDSAVSCLAPGGRIVVTTPTPLGNDLVHRVLGFFGFLGKTATQGHYVIYNGARLRLLAETYGLTIERYTTFQLGCNQLVVMRKG
jgi:SAM-dependent methyltransferase